MGVRTSALKTVWPQNINNNNRNVKDDIVVVSVILTNRTEPRHSHSFNLVFPVPAELELSTCPNDLTAVSYLRTALLCMNTQGGLHIQPKGNATNWGRFEKPYLL